MTGLGQDDPDVLDNNPGHKGRLSRSETPAAAAWAHLASRNHAVTIHIECGERPCGTIHLSAVAVLISVERGYDRYTLKETRRVAAPRTWSVVSAFVVHVQGAVRDSLFQFFAGK